MTGQTGFHPPVLIRWSAPPIMLLLLLTLSCTLADAQRDPFIELSEFIKFPKHFLYDDFEDCRREHEADFAFCVVHAKLARDDSSELWRNISRYSKSEHHYDHTTLERGVCIPKCEKLLRMAGSLPVAKQSMAQLAHACIHAQLTHQYDLELADEVDIYHCYTAENINPPVDFLEAMFYVVLATILGLVMASTVYDMREKGRQGYPNNFFVRLPKSKRDRLLAAFSFPRNIYRLKDSVDGKIRQDLQFLEAFRFIQMLRVVFLHVTLAQTKLPSTNTDFIEGIQHKPIIIFYVAEFQNYIQTFLSISGMLLTINFLEYIRKNPDFHLGIFWEKFRGRLCRILPAYAFVILLESSIMKRWSDGPMGQQYLGEAQDNCRRWGWTNLLFINNYIRTDQPCLIQSWYLAVDLQLFIYGMVVMMVIWRWPWLQKYIFSVAFTCAFVIPTVTTYVNNVEPAMTNRLKNADHYNRKHNYQFDIYFPFQQNIGVYSFGMLAGFIYHRYRDSRETVLDSKLYSYLFRAATVLYFLCMTSVYWILLYRNEIPKILLAIYSTLFKQCWAILSTFLQLTLALTVLNSWWKKFFSHPIFGIGGKLSYSFYLIHFTVIEVIYGETKAPMYTNKRIISTFMAQIFWWTLTLGALLSVLVEMPAAAALKELLDRRKPKIDSIQHTQVSVTELQQRTE